MGRNQASAGAKRRKIALQKNNRRARQLKSITTYMLAVVDTVMLAFAFMLGHQARMVIPLFPIPAEQPRLFEYLPTMLTHIVTIGTLFYFSRLYHQQRSVSRIDLWRNIIGAVTVGSLLASGIQDLIFRNTVLEVDYPRAMFFYVWFFTMVMVLAGRELYRLVNVRLRERGINRDNLLIVGTGKVAREMARKIKSEPALGYHIVGVVNGGSSGTLLDIPIIGTYSELPVLIDTYNVEQVIIALPDVQRNELVDLITLCQRGHVDIKVYPDLLAHMSGDLNLDDLGGTPLITVRDIALRGWRLSLKRALDILGSLFGMIFLSPFMLLTALAIRMESEGPIFYTQERMGLDGKRFEIIKFRTMRADAERHGAGWTVANDPRVTRLGALMRKTSWDEIPQLINVLAGQMSLVGPRPERPVYVEQFQANIPRYMERHREKAGMTGWAQVNGLRGNTSIAERTSYDLWYVENWSVWLDIKIIVWTVLRVVLRRDKNAY